MHDPNALVPDWSPPPVPPAGLTLEGRYALVSPLYPSHCEALFAAFSKDHAVWDYMPYGPFTGQEDYSRWVEGVSEQSDPHFFAITDKDTGAVSGQASFLRIAPEAGSIEVGHIALSPALQRTRAATEAMVLMMQWAIEAGYRRYEWKCNAANLASRRAAQRLGLSYEGVFRKAAVVKGRNRDTAWFAVIDEEWPSLNIAFDQWLKPDNFDAKGRQMKSLSTLTRPILAALDPAQADL